MKIQLGSLWLEGQRWSLRWVTSYGAKSGIQKVCEH